MNANKITFILTAYFIVMVIIVWSISTFGAPALFLRDSLNIVCTSNYTAPALPGNMSIMGTMTVHFGKNNLGTFNISGLLEQNNQEMALLKPKQIILREVSFNYTVEDNGFIAILNPKIFHTASDQVSDELFNQHVFDLSRASRQLKVTRVNDAWLFGTSFSPVIMCVNKT